MLDPLWQNFLDPRMGFNFIQRSQGFLHYYYVPVCTVCQHFSLNYLLIASRTVPFLDFRQWVGSNVYIYSKGRVFQ